LSEIRATTISDAAGTGPITLTGQSAAKAWANVNGTGTITINGSFNLSSILDNGVGDITNTFVNAMSNTSYVQTHSGGYVNDDGMARYSEATTSWRTYYYELSTRNSKDGSVNASAIHGDLA
jgi:hypothetical protein